MQLQRWGKCFHVDTCSLHPNIKYVLKTVRCILDEIAQLISGMQDSLNVLTLQSCCPTRSPRLEFRMLLAVCAAYKLPPLLLNEDTTIFKTFVSLRASFSLPSSLSFLSLFPLPFFFSFYSSIICPLHQKNCKWKFHKCSRIPSFAVCSTSSVKVLSLRDNC